MNWDYPLIIATLSAIFAGIGLILNWLALRENNKTRQVQLFNEVFNSIIEKEKLLYDKYKNADKKTQKEWDSLFFNSIERLSFLVNKGFIKDKKIIKFFEDAVIMWYEELFKKHYDKAKIEDSKVFPEFKELYHNIKSK